MASPLPHSPESTNQLLHCIADEVSEIGRAYDSGTEHSLRKVKFVSRALGFTMKTDASPVPIPHVASNYDELSMKQALQFSDCLKELKSLKQQLYSAAEHFESSYSKQEQKQIVMASLKDYALKAFINTVDHLGSMSYKVNCLLNEKSDELSTMALPFSCFEQRFKTCQQFINQEGLSQQSLFIKLPSHHARYTIPDPDRTSGEIPAPFMRRWQHPAEYVPGSSAAEEPLSFTKASPSEKSGMADLSDKRAASPFRFQLARSGSPASRSASPKRSSSNAKRRYPSEPRRSSSPSARAERDSRCSDLEIYAGKNKRMFKALLSMRKPKNSGSLYKYLDEN